MTTTAAEEFSTADAQSNNFVPPYISFAQLENVLERMRNEGVPARIDRSYLASWSGSAQAQFLKATANLELRDEHGRPTDLLKRLVAEPEGRPGIVGQMLNDKYPSVIALGADATQQQLEEEFRKFEGIGGSTVRKAIRFYLHAAKFAGIKTSPFFKSGRATASTVGQRTTRAKARRVAPEDTPDPPAPVVGTTPQGLHPAVLTLVQALPAFGDHTKPEFSSAERDAWFAYAKATFNLIYALPDSDKGSAI